MELFGIAFSVPVAFVMSLVYGAFIVRLRATKELAIAQQLVYGVHSLSSACSSSNYCS